MFQFLFSVTIYETALLHKMLIVQKMYGLILIFTSLHSKYLFLTFNFCG